MLLRTLIAGLALVVVLVGVGAAYLATRDPLAALPQAERPPAAAGRETRGADGRTWVYQALEDPVLGRFRLTLSLPDPLPEGPLPVIVVLGGLGTGEENLRHIQEPGNNALVGYDWPVPPRLPRGLALVRHIPDLYRRLMGVPGQVAAGLAWVAQRPWADSERVSLLGFSLGALVAPAVQRLAAVRGRSVGWTVLAYGGAGLGALLANHPGLRPRWMGPLYGRLADLILRPLEPALHLPYLSGRFLVISGRDDTFIPAPASARFRSLTPEPKTVAVLEGGHMGVGPGQRALLAEILRLSRDWLVAEGAVNAP